MTFTPILPSGGLLGWQFLQRTMDVQRERFEDSTIVKRNIDQFRETIASADTAEKLVADPQLLRVALEAFGLGAELPKKAFIRAALEGGTEAEGAFATRLVDPRWREFVGAFGYGDAKGAQVAEPGFADDIVARYKVRSFEEAVGAVDESMRLALNFEREAARLAGSGAAEDTIWLRLLGDPALRATVEGAFGMPQEFAQLDLDRQVEELKSRFSRVFGGDVTELANDEPREAFIRRFLALDQINQAPSSLTPGATALTLLQSGGIASANLFASRL